MHRLDRFWDSPDLGQSGPSELLLAEAVLMENRESLLGAGEQIILRFCLDLWNRSGGVSLAELITDLDPMISRAIGELLMAFGDGPSTTTLDEWVWRWRDFDAKAAVST